MTAPSASVPITERETRQIEAANVSGTEVVKVPKRGHALTIDSFVSPVGSKRAGEGRAAVA